MIRFLLLFTICGCNRLERMKIPLPDGSVICYERDFNWYNRMIHDWHEMPCIRRELGPAAPTNNGSLLDQHTQRLRGERL